MFIPAKNEEHDAAVLQAHIKAHPLGTWVTQGDGELLVNHLPFLLDTARGEHGTLVGHVARANPVWRSFSTSLPSVVAFMGAQAYISPSWYPSKASDGKAVPTWNYAVVHAHGLPRVIEDRDWLLQHVNDLSEAHEAAQKRPWKVSDAPPQYIDQMLNAIVGIEIPISRLRGKWKVSQNRPQADRQGVIQGLLASGDPRDEEMAGLVGRYLEP